MYFMLLFGYTKCHCGIAIQHNGFWVFHCADALPTNAQFDLTSQWLNRLNIGSHVPRLQAWASSHPKFVCLQVKCGSLSLNNRLPADYQQRGDFFKRIIEISGFIDGIIPP
jgi:hypothetical protein